jgi:hypothetical protein
VIIGSYLSHRYYSFGGRAGDPVPNAPASNPSSSRRID